MGVRLEPRDLGVSISLGFAGIDVRKTLRLRAIKVSSFEAPVEQATPHAA